MLEELIDLEKLSKVSKLSKSTVRVYLAHYSLTSYYRGKGCYVLNEAFITKFAKYLAIKKKAENCFAVENWWENHKEYCKRMRRKR